MTFENVAEVIGVTGAACYLITYIAFNYSESFQKSVFYLLLNALSAALILYSTFYFWNLATAITQSCWIVISIAGIIRIMKRKKLVDPSGIEPLTSWMQIRRSPSWAKDPYYAFEYKSILLAKPIKWWARRDLNLRPHAYQACALTNWATSPHKANHRFVCKPRKHKGE